MMTSNCSIEVGTDRFAVPDALSHSRVKLRDIVAGVGRDPSRNPAEFAWNGQLGELLLIASSPSDIEFLPLHRCPRSRRQLEVALFAVDLEQERRPSVHATANLKGNYGTVSDNTVDDELVGHGLCDDFAGFLDRNAVALAHDAGGELAKFAKAIASRIDRMSRSEDLRNRR